MSDQPIVGDLPLVESSRFAALGDGYWERNPDWERGELGFGLGRWDAGNALERLQELLHEKGQEEEGSDIVLKSDHMVRYQYTVNGYKSRREQPLVRMPYHPDVLPHWEAYAAAKMEHQDLHTFQIRDIKLPPSPFFANNLMPILKSSNSSLTRLDLVHCRLSSKDVACVAKFLSKNTSLVALDITSSTIDSGKVAWSLSKAMKKHPTLIFANLSGCGLGENSDVLSAILDGSVTLTSLIIERNGIESDGMALVLDFLSNNSTTTVFSLGGNEIGVDNATTLCKVLNRSGTVRELSLGSCGLGLPAFLSSKCMTQQLICLNLSGNRIMSKGSVLIADFLERNPSLLELNLASNMLPTGAAARFASAMKTNTNLQHLNLKKNHFTDKAVPSFMDMLSGNTTLLSLQLTGNNIKVESGRKQLIQNALCDARSLEAIVNSNHTCKLTFSSRRCKSTYEMEIRNINGLESEGQKIRYKVVLALFAINKELFNPRDFDDVPLELMPRLLELAQQELGYNGFGKGIVEKTRKRRPSNEDPTLDRLYKVVHGWNIPLLVERGPGNQEKKTRKRKR